MKAIVVREFGPPEVMKLEEVPNPSPGPGQVLMRVSAVGVNPVDTYIRSGTVRAETEPAVHARHRHRRHRRSHRRRREEREGRRPCLRTTWRPAADTRS